MQKEIEGRINSFELEREVKLSGKIKLSIDKGKSFMVGHTYLKGIINVMRSNVVIDGSNAQIEAEIADCTASDWCLFFVHPQARNVHFKNMNIRVRIDNAEDSNRLFAAIYNTAFGLKLTNCHIEVYSEKQNNIVGVYNNGNLDTHMETRADNLVIENCQIKVECLASEFSKESTTYGLYNNLANSISMQNTYIYSTNRGNCERQKAIGVYTNGRFGRYVGNNIKANGTHNKGFEKEQAHAYGFINEGMYSIITSNNIVGEWAGKSVGLENKGSYTIVNSNKILSTHTICGRTVINSGINNHIESNVITSTSRNARLIEHSGAWCIISKNIMEVLMPEETLHSGCGIYAVDEYSKENIISENIIRNVLDVGIFANESIGEIRQNRVCSFARTIEKAGTENSHLIDKLDERNIRSIKE